MLFRSVFELIKTDVQAFLKTKALTKGQIERYIFDNISYKAPFLPADIPLEQMETWILELAQKELAEKEKLLRTEEKQRDFYRLCLLKAIDTSWIEEVDTLEQLKGSVTARISAQRNPIYEYHFEALRAYQVMKADFRRRAVQNLLLSTITIRPDGKIDIYFA